MSLYSKLISNQESLALVGLGYVGMPIAHAFAKKGLNVVGFDLNKNKIALYARIWNCSQQGIVLFARYTTNFDCKTETNWWYVIKDDEFDISSLKSKRRNVVKKGIENFRIDIIDPDDYRDELYDVLIKAYTSYPEKYRPNVKKEQFVETLGTYKKEIVENKKLMIGAFFTETNELCGFIVAGKHESYVSFNILRVDPDYEKHQINAALVFGLLEYFKENLKERNGFYICDGERSISHETHFQDYLEKYFGFRKAYCNLHIIYRNWVKPLVKISHLFRKTTERFDNIGIIHQINSLLKMDDLTK